MKFTNQELDILMSLIQSAKYMAEVTQPDNELKHKLKALYDKLNNQ